MIDVFIDTNILHSRNEQLDKVLFVEKLKEIIEEIEINDIYTEIKILLGVKSFFNCSKTSTTL